MLKKIGITGSLGVRIATSLIAIVFLLVGFFTLWDMYKTEMRAFASYDLLKYRPDIENDEPPYLDELLKINPDTAAWVTIYGTNIDYPIFQGEDDKEYLNKNAYGDFAITGSIFLATLNHKDFSDPYNLIYGHHMENGSMFGDIDKFNRKGFFYNKNKQRYKMEEGVLIMENRVYNLHVFGLLHTSAYDHEVYRADKTKEQTQQFLTYAQEKCTYFIPQDKDTKILAMSTCDNAVTDARTVLLCSMTLRTEPLPTREEEQLTKHVAIGHPMAGAYWALMNLAALLLCLYVAFPVHIKADRALAYIRKRRNNKPEDVKKRIKRPDRYTVILIVTCIVTFILFVLTEDMHKPLQLVDIYTPLFIALTITAWSMQKLRLTGERNGKINKNKEGDSSRGHVPLRTALSAYLLRIRRFYFD